MKPITVLSLFDGISCGQQALKELKIPVAKYYASEIEQSAIAITKKNFPQTIHLGYVQDVKAKNLPKIDLIFAGSPCQGFSTGGKGLNFNDPRSKLFFEFVRILNECKKFNPKVIFLLENVRMKKEWAQVITDQVGVKPVIINSSLVSAQSRNRMYWSNLNITQPIDKKIVLRDILIEPPFEGVRGSFRTDTNKTISYNGNLKILDPDKKHPCLTLCDSARHIATGMKSYREISIIEMERLQSLPDNYTFGIAKTHRHNALGNGWNVATIKHILKPLTKIK